MTRNTQDVQTRLNDAWSIARALQATGEIAAGDGRAVRVEALVGRDTALRIRQWRLKGFADYDEVAALIRSAPHLFLDGGAVLVVARQRRIEYHELDALLLEPNVETQGFCADRRNTMESEKLEGAKVPLERLFGPVAYMAFGYAGSTPIALCEYTGATQLAVYQKIAEVARRQDGYQGTGIERAMQLGWQVAPVFMLPNAI